MPDDTRPVLGTFHEMARWSEARCARPLSFLDPQWTDPAAWQAHARGVVQGLLSWDPPSVPLDARVEETRESDGLVTEKVSWAQPFGPRTEAFVVRPARAAGRLPAIVALHDHSAFYWQGKEKVVAAPGEMALVTELKAKEYGGVSWATEAARRGYVVIAPDAFYFGSRRIDPATVPGDLAAAVLAHPAGSRARIEAFNDFAWDHETLLAKTLFLSGTTWPGIMAWEDRRAVDYLLSRPDVAADRVGCGGLSGGGLRTVYLAALDPRVRCAAVAGFMSTADEVIERVVRHHTWMFHVPRLSALMDLPDVASLHGPLPLMVLYDRDDPIWTLAGQERADAKLTRIYGKMGAAAAYRGAFYPGPHKFDLPMQADAFDWFDRWLR